MGIHVEHSDATGDLTQKSVRKSVWIIGPLLFLLGCQSHSRSEPLDRLSPEEKSDYKHIQAELSTYKQGEPLEQFLARLHVQDAPFDRLYTNMLGHENRLYHLGNYFLRIDIEDRDGQWYTGYFHPALHVDGLTQEQRMQRFDEAFSAYLGEKQERLESTRRDAPAQRK